eukprot:TRINITY_DN18194_c0_g1_i5.p1 TRINITY_DN18194_c0_g1~~TRINITY_DN18194_c0_g1_i5.p1  ORF type:complete len:551 (-),score=86.79 TRINITY_DN18194_c0_g1_i5:246-1820(-)
MAGQSSRLQFTDLCHTSSDEDASHDEQDHHVQVQERRKAEEIKAKWAPLAPRKYVLPVGTVLAGCAGYVNAAAFLTGGAFVSHMTGTSTKLGMAIEGYYMDDWDHDRIWQAVFLVVSFIVGSFICGLLVSRSEVHFGKSMYGVALTLNSLLLFASIWVFNSVDTSSSSSWPVFLNGKLLSCYLQACACGLQNGMCTAHFGAVVRTTHVTGLVTDCGLSLGRIANVFCRRRCRRSNLGLVDWTEVRIDATKLKVFTCLLAGFICGVFIGTYIQHQIGVACFAIPAFITGIGGLAYSIAKQTCWQLFQEAEAAQLTKDLSEAEEIFERAKDQLQEARFQRAASEVGVDEQVAAMDAIDSRVKHALDRLRDLEASLQEVHEKVDSRFEAAEPKQKRPARPHADEGHSRGGGNSGGSYATAAAALAEQVQSSTPLAAGPMGQGGGSPAQSSSVQSSVATPKISSLPRTVPATRAIVQEPPLPNSGQQPAWAAATQRQRVFLHQGMYPHVPAFGAVPAPTSAASTAAST